MRKGFSLTEVLMVIGVIMILSVPLGRLSRIAVRDVPDAWRLSQVNTSVLNMLGRLQNDVENATTLPKSSEGYIADANTILVESPSGTICYRLENEQVTRYKIKQDGKKWENTASWSIPKADIEWNIRRKKQKSYAVEVHTYIKKEVGMRVEKKFENSYLYFAGTAGF